MPKQSVEMKVNNFQHRLALQQQKTEQELYYIKQQLECIRTAQQEGMLVVKQFTERNELFHNNIDKRVCTLEVKGNERDQLFSTVTKLIWGAAILGLAAFMSQLGQVFLAMLD